MRYGGSLYVSAHQYSRDCGPGGFDPAAPRGLFRIALPSEPDAGRTELLSRRYESPRILAVDADFTWTWDYNIRRAPRRGGEPERLPFSNPAWLVVDGNEVVVAWDNIVSSVARKSAFTGDLKVDGVRVLAKEGWGSRVVVRGEDAMRGDCVVERHALAPERPPERWTLVLEPGLAFYGAQSPDAARGFPIVALPLED